MPSALDLFGNEIRRLRTARGLSQEKLAELSAVHRNYIGRVERGEKNTGFLYILKISIGLNLKPADLLKHMPKLTHADLPPEPKKKKGKKEK